MRLLKTTVPVPVLVAVLLAAPATAQNTTPDIATTAPADAWRQFRGNPSLTGVSEATLPEELTLLWTYEADEAIDSSAAIADGTVYVGTYAGTLIALDLETGEERWTYTTGDLGIGESWGGGGGGRVVIGERGVVVHDG
ncbi:MAG: PQQ-binding-like beta-propeller repeat protein [Vicinamibacterales bacterium]|nr:PQQ-binding-like beta-propeller repeat protein [Vicinamibacterales bacterium]